MLCKDIPEGALDEVHAWLTMSDAGWAVAVLGQSSSRRQRCIGESFGDVSLSNVRADYIGCPRPTAAMGGIHSTLLGRGLQLLGDHTAPH